MIPPSGPDECRGREHLWSGPAALLAQAKDAGLQREAETFDDDPQDKTGVVRIDSSGRRLVTFSSNDYLNLARDSRVVEAANTAARKYGCGAGASRLITGTWPVHEELEAALADFKQSESALLFSSGYLANLGAVDVLTRREDGTRAPVIFDKLCHASLVDAIRLFATKWRTFHHNDLDHLEEQLRKFRSEKSYQPAALVITEGVFSMDGDCAPLPEILNLCERYGAAILIDDAHGTGTMGSGGRGTASMLGVSAHPLMVQTGTLSKSMGSQGGFIAGPAVVIRAAINMARAFIYDTALAPPQAGAALESLKILTQEPVRVQRLEKNARMLRNAIAGIANLNLIPAPESSPIVPVVLGSAECAIEAGAKMRHDGFLVKAIRPPTVPACSSRLRITLTSGHSENQIQALISSLALLE